MKYQEGYIVLLNSGETVYISSIDKKAKKYQVYNIDNDEELFFVSESDICMLVT